MVRVIFILLLLPLLIQSILDLVSHEDFFHEETFSDIDRVSQEPSQTPELVPESINNLQVPEFPPVSHKSSRMRVQNGPPGFMPPKQIVSKMTDELDKDLDDNHFGFITRKGRARVLGISRRRPDQFHHRRQ